VSAVLERPVVMGSQVPRIRHVAEGADYRLADDSVRWVEEVAGFTLDSWQRMVLRESLAEGEPGKWARTEVGLLVPRQNGKGAVLEAREILGLFRLGEQLLIHTAHQYKTAQEHFLRVAARIEDVPELKNEVKAIRTAAGEQGVISRDGNRLRFLARKGGSGRGFSAPFVAFDEAYELAEATMADMVPATSAMPRRQRWYTGSAVDQMTMDNGVVLARVRERGLRGDEQRLAYFEWSLDLGNPDDLDPEVVLDEEALALSNPAYGIRISREAVEDETKTLAHRTAAVERHNVGDWPPTSGLTDFVIDPALWDSLEQAGFRSEGLQPCFGFDVAPDQAWASILAGFPCEDGLPLLEVVEHRPGVRWLVDRLVELCAEHDPFAVLCGDSSPAMMFVHRLEEHDISVEVVSTGDHAKACNLVVSLVENEGLRHRGEPELQSAVRGAARRYYGDSWLWSRKLSRVDISPLVAGTLALWGWSTLFDGETDWTIF
jgi:hypothetical protein